MTDLATIRIPVDTSDMVKAVQDGKSLERGIKMLVGAFDAGVIGADQFSKGLLQLEKEYKNLFTSSQQATSAVRGHAKSLQESAAAADIASAAKNNLAMATKRAETAFALANQKAKEELQTLRNRAEFAWAMAMQREQESQKAVQAAQRQAQAESKLTSEILRRRQAQESAAVDKASAFQSQIGSNLGLGAQGISAGASAGAFEAEIERLRQKYDKIYVSSQLYERSLTELNKAHALGVLSTKQHESALESLNAEYQNFQNGTAGIGNRFAQNIQQNMAGVSNAGVLMQQLGYQAGDFIVQVQSGTNAFVAFGQQATQMVGFLPMMAQSMNIATVSVLGFNVAIAPLTLGLSIVIPLLTAAGALWMRTSSDSDSAAKSIDRQAQAYNTLIDRVRELRLERQMEATGVASQEEQIVLNDLNKLLENRVVLQDRLNQLQNAGGRAAGYAQAKQEQMDLLQADIDRNEAAIKAIQYERDLATAASRRANEQRNAYREAKAEADRWKASLEGIKSVLDSMNGMAVSVTLDLQSTASGWASEFLGKLTSGLENKAEYVKAVGGGRGLGMGGPELDPYGFRDQLSRVPKAKTGSSGGGGGKRQEDLRKEIELTKELTQAEKDRQSIIRSVDNALEDGFMSMVEGTKSVKDAFKSMARDIIKELYRVLVIQRMVGSITGGLDLFSGPSTGSFGLPFGGANASGGSMVTGKSYLVGENGPELVIPRHSGTVVNANQTAAMGSGSGSFTQNLSINVTGSDAAMVRTEVAKMIPQITNATKSAIIDAKQRGGQMAAAFR